MVLEVRVEEVGVHGVNDVAGDEEGVCVCSAEGGVRFAVGGEFFSYALHDAGEEVAVGALAEERTYFFVVEDGHHADLRGARERRGRVEERLHGGPGAELVVDAAGEDELSVETAGLRGLGVEEFELPVDDCRICEELVAC